MQNSNSGEAIANLLASGLGIALVGVAVLIMLAILLGICFVLSRSLAAVPAEHRKVEPGMVWLLLIPCFNVIWNFYVFLKIPDSFKSYFNSVGRTDVGDCGRNLGLWYSIATVLSFIPFVGLISLVLLILSLVKFNELKNKITNP